MAYSVIFCELFMSCHHSEIEEDIWGYLQNVKCSVLNLTAAFGKNPGDDYAGKEGTEY